MNSQPKKSHTIVREITLILIIKVILLLIIKHIWFDQPTIPKNFNHQVVERIVGNTPSTPPNLENKP